MHTSRCIDVAAAVHVVNKTREGRLQFRVSAASANVMCKMSGLAKNVGALGVGSVAIEILFDGSRL